MPVFSQSKRKVVEKTIDGESLSFYQLSALDRIEYFESSKAVAHDADDNISMMKADLETSSLLVAYALKPGLEDDLKAIQAEIKALPGDIIKEMYDIAADMAGFQKMESEDEEKKP